MVTDIKSSPTPIEPIQFLTDITIKEFVQQFEIVISESVRTNGSQYDITPPARPNHPFEETSNHFNSDGQPCDLILQLQYPWPIFNEDNSWGDKLKCFSGDRNATSYSVCGTLHGSITMALITWGPGLEGHQLCGVIHRSHKLAPAMEHQQLRSNNAPDAMYHAYQHDIISPIYIIKTPEFCPGTQS